jgi:UDPglucose 6-dehydrogenase
MDVVVIGTGYVGLVTGTCLAETGNKVTCVDIDQAKIDGLNQGVIPIYEPGLESMVKKNAAEGRLRFTTSLVEAMRDANIYFIGVGTPPREDGSANLDFVLDVAREIGVNLNQYSVVVDKSTVPVGTADRVRATIEKQLVSRKVQIPFDVVSNPEFLKEGAAVSDFMRPDRIIVGTESRKAAEIMEQLYAPFNHRADRLLVMGTRDAEMAKYAANAMLATKISFMNEIAGLCDELGVDVEMVRQGIGSDSRIGYSFIYPGCGYGGSCFPKDVKALVHMAQQHGFEPKVLNAVEERNAAQKRVMFEKVVNHCGGDVRDRTVAVWGLAFKPETDDMREASSVTLIEALIGAGAKVRAYDPIAMDEARRVFPSSWLDQGNLTLAHDQYDALRGADALALVTEWNPFRNPDFHLMLKIMDRPIIVDGRNLYDPDLLSELGFDYSGIGRSLYQTVTPAVGAARQMAPAGRPMHAPGKRVHGGDMS